MKRLWILAAIAALGCGGDSSTSPAAPTVVGSWYLQTIDGRALPASDGTYSYPAGQLVMRADGTFRASTDIRGPFPDASGQTTIRTISFVYSGTWTLSGNQLTTTDTDADGDGARSGVSPGFFNVNSITVDWGDTGFSGFGYGRL